MSSTRASPGPSLLSAELSPTLSFLTNPIAYYFSAHPPYNNVVLEALIFTPPPNPPRILLLQRSGGADPHAFAQFWQVPGGQPTGEDASLLHTLSRIVFEQTGLQLSRVDTISGTEYGPPSIRGNGPATWMRMLFMVGVKDLERSPSSESYSEQIALSPSVESYSERFALDEFSEYSGSDTSIDLDSVRVAVNPVKHSKYVWASEDELRGFEKSGLYPMEERAQYQIMLEAFAFWRQDFTQLQQLRMSRENTAFSGIGP